MKTFAELDSFTRFSVALKLRELGAFEFGARGTRKRMASRALARYVADSPFRHWTCNHLYASCDADGYCSMCGRRWPESPDGLPFD